MLNLEKFRHAQSVLQEVITKTDIMKTKGITEECELYLKPENLQVTGSFKVRGAYYKISQLSEEEKAKGVIACSAGNHAQGVALAAQRKGIHAVICLPEGAPISKVEATRSYGAEICMVPGVYDDAHNQAIKLKEEKGYTFIAPFDDEDIIAGQGTIALEIIEQLKDVDVIVSAIGGGGLCSGIAVAAKLINPAIRVYGVQSTGAPSMKVSLDHGKILSLDHVDTVADGIKVKQPGDITFDLCKNYVDGVVTVNDDETSTAILTLMEKQKIVAEGAGAVAVAAVMFGKIPDIKGKKVCCVISGGNIDVTILNRVITRGLQMTGRTCLFNIELLDKPGQLVGVSKIIASCGGNVTSVLHERSDQGSDITGCYLRITVETRNFAHIAEITEKLEKAGFKLKKN